MLEDVTQQESSKLSKSYLKTSHDWKISEVFFLNFHFQNVVQERDKTPAEQPSGHRANHTLLQRRKNGNENSFLK